MSYMVALVLAGLGSAAVYAVLTFICAMVAMFSKYEHRREIAQNLFNTLLLRSKSRAGTPELPRGGRTAAPPADETPDGSDSPTS
ncbi:hypothetical protein [Acrocarpospora sp. B8E8]|uniref:hypothetical protein n=1 Tax=Acrocarpospora sp. B8E8 TaxID=3153572 RepID=UPI00325FC8C6